MRTSLAALFTCLLSGFLLVPAAPQAGEDERRPIAVLSATPNPTTLMQAVSFDAARTVAAPDAGMHRYEWDLDGDGELETDTGTTPTAKHVYTRSGTVTIRLLVTDARGREATAELALAVTPGSTGEQSVGPTGAERPDPVPEGVAPRPLVEPRATEPAGDGSGSAGPGRRPGGSERRPDTDGIAGVRGGDHGAGLRGGGGDGGDGRSPRRALPRLPLSGPYAARALRDTPPLRAMARVSATSGVVIQNFDFNPGTIEVKVGDRVTWTNQDGTEHTATSTSGEFDTGLLNRGESGSHTFDRAGTYSYICRPHRSFMKGTVRVSARGSGGGSTGTDDRGSGDAGRSSGGDDAADLLGGSDGAESSGGGSTAEGDSDLPTTGADLLAFSGLGLFLAVLGFTARRGLEPGCATPRAADVTVPREGQP